MKKIMSTFMLLLVVFSNCFLYCFANEGETITETWNTIENENNFDSITIQEETKWSEESNKKTKSETNYSCDECVICDDYYDEIYDDLCMFCLLECEEDDSWINNRSELDTWEDEDLPNLIISEVFFGWKNERIEVYNAWDLDFYGDLTFRWVYNWTTDRSFSWVEIPAGWIKIFWNFFSIFTYILKGDFMRNGFFKLSRAFDLIGKGACNSSPPLLIRFNTNGLRIYNSRRADLADRRTRPRRKREVLFRSI